MLSLIQPRQRTGTIRKQLLGRAKLIQNSRLKDRYAIEPPDSRQSVRHHDDSRRAKLSVYNILDLRFRLRIDTTMN